ncbi:MAG TPA: efflux RND transporter periplasmic adaptor subunit [Rhodopila sp.]|uniref:efflux RND transporter periplasmic adaptor subunit n=1 Tax=Rhodopila sp. TaxID=2480087 RepID=UPI002B8BF84F|nr:efflux RND transporter periplasmic adaptor subunit [Rhodopila sp.]HVY14651.1 efflux RND transporter periplasmic adaptor subunit [Rhodopila sp.]
MPYDSADIMPPAAGVRGRRVTLGVAGLVVAAGLAGAALTIRPWEAAPPPAAHPAPPPVLVTVARAERKETTLWTEFSGRTEAVDRVDVRPRAAGAIVAVHFREGSLVHKGDPLFTIDPAPYAADVARLEAQVASAQSQVELAAIQEARARKLVPTNAIPQSELDQRVNDRHVAEATLQAAQAQLAVARLNLGYTQVVAPIDGRVGKIDVTPGNLVPAGSTAPVLTTLVSVDPIYASFDADERTVARALASLPAGASIERIPVEMGTLATDGTPLHGTLQYVGNVVDTRSGTVQLRAKFANPDGRLLPGQFARIRLGRPEPTPVIAIDEQAISTDQDRRYVFVVGNDNKVSYRLVKLGPMNDGLRTIAAGLNPGERIVVDGLQRVQPGSVVAPHLVAMGTVTRTERLTD